MMWRGIALRSISGDQGPPFAHFRDSSTLVVSFARSSRRHAHGAIPRVIVLQSGEQLALSVAQVARVRQASGERAVIGQTRRHFPTGADGIDGKERRSARPVAARGCRDGARQARLAGHERIPGACQRDQRGIRQHHAHQVEPGVLVQRVGLDGIAPAAVLEQEARAECGANGEAGSIATCARTLRSS